MNFLYLLPDKCQYLPPGKPPLEFIYPEGSLKNLEITDKEKLAAAFSNFLDTNQITNSNISVTIGEGVSFRKNIVVADPAQAQKEIDQFVSEVPLAPEKQVFSKENSGQGLTIAATNREIYETFVTLLEEKKNTVDMVIMVRDLEMANPDSLLTQNVRNLLDLGIKKTKIKLPLILGSIAIIGLITFGVVYIVVKMFGEPAVVTSPTREIPKVVEEVKKVFTPRENLKINILNGTSVSGLAKKFQDKLSLEFKNITIGNTQEIDRTLTTVTVLDSVSSQDIDLITQTLETNFAKVETTTTSSGVFDIEIILGQPK